MGHPIVDANLEDGQLKYVIEELPERCLKVDLIYDTTQGRISKQQIKGDREEDRFRDKAASA